MEGGDHVAGLRRSAFYWVLIANSTELIRDVFPFSRRKSLIFAAGERKTNLSS
jgi:hypothetical protein